MPTTTCAGACSAVTAAGHALSPLKLCETCTGHGAHSGGSMGCADVEGKQSMVEETSVPFSLTSLIPSMLFSPFAQLLEG